MQTITLKTLEQRIAEHFPNLKRAFDPVHSDFDWSCVVCKAGIKPANLDELTGFGIDHRHPIDEALAQRYVELAAR